MGTLQFVDKLRVLSYVACSHIFVFSATGALKKHIISENPLAKRIFKGTGVALAGIECSQKILFFANGIPVQDSGDFVDTLKACIIYLRAVRRLRN